MPGPTLTPGFDAAKQNQVKLDRHLKDAGHRFGVHGNILRQVDAQEKLEAELRQYFDQIYNAAEGKHDRVAWENLTNFMKGICAQDEKLNVEMQNILNIRDTEQRQKSLRGMLQNQALIALAAKALLPLYMKKPNLEDIFSQALNSPLQDVMEDWEQCARQAGYSGAEARTFKQIMNLILSALYAFANLCSIKMGNGPFDFKLDGTPINSQGEEGKKPDRVLRLPAPAK